jgi:hypothetical protein
MGTLVYDVHSDVSNTALYQEYKVFYNVLEQQNVVEEPGKNPVDLYHGEFVESLDF